MVTARVRIEADCSSSPPWGEGIISAAPSNSCAPGFTLVEILAALAVLAVGLASVLAIVLRSSRISIEAARRNAAAMIISEAVAEIERRHLITSTNYGYSIDKVGLLIETLKSSNPNIHDNYAYMNLAGEDKSTSSLFFDAQNHLRLPPYLSSATIPITPDTVNTLPWPLGTPKYVAGPTIEGNQGLDSTTSGTAYRVVYRLERHPDWQSHPAVDSGNGVLTYPYGSENLNSSFLGIYVLTLIVYADPTTVCARLEQISDPVVVYLRDKKAR